MAHRSDKLTLLKAQAKTLLDNEWDVVMAFPSVSEMRDSEWGPILEGLLTQSGLTYPYVLLGQVLGKAVDKRNNALTLQKSSKLAGAWDARSFVNDVVVPWNAKVGKPIPGVNKTPYVNNPARYANFGSEMKAKADKKADSKKWYAALDSVVRHIQKHGDAEARRILRLILIEVRHFLETNKRPHLGPPRVSVDRVTNVLREFLRDRSNGTRLQVVCYAVYKTIAVTFPGFGDVRSYPTNSADAAGNRAGDIEIFVDGKVQIAIEVKDNTVTMEDLDTTIMKARGADVRNVLFLIQANPLLEDEKAILERTAHEFTSGIDVNIAEATAFIRTILVMLSPEARAGLLRRIHDALHELGAHYKHVTRWAELMRSI
ncbi:restriction endonuclease, SacI family [Burkholderia vietnamiensis]|uniref:restriction endonuclease, SacI family n=1 Tax=Burkholderia vietnamiensis TaxID=60552 RepID=UPI001CF1FD72|nr:restriction endonuclease, SacI family [Burkholderia vietnamiensis]MCA8199190.1 restriction endonuclease, SacI family [Burkholderia vietnamiensis]